MNGPTDSSAGRSQRRPTTSQRTVRAERPGQDPRYEDRLLTKEETAQALNVAVRFVERCVIERRIRYVKIGRYIRIPQSAIDEYLAAATVEAYPIGKRTGHALHGMASR